jgi:hypothetical protein
VKENLGWVVWRTMLSWLGAGMKNSLPVGRPERLAAAADFALRPGGRKRLHVGRGIRRICFAI